jgi:hypothetical protein
MNTHKCNVTDCQGMVAQHIADMTGQTLVLVIDDIAYPADPYAMQVYCDEHAVELTYALVMAYSAMAWDARN